MGMSNSTPEKREEREEREEEKRERERKKRKGKKLFLVTGGSGFVATHLIPLLLQEGHRVRTLNRSKDPELASLPGVECVEGSVTSRETVFSAASGVSAIFHLAGVVLHSRYNTQQMEDVNIQGTKNIMEAAAAYQLRVVYASTSGTVGCFKNPNSIANDSSPYALETVKDWPYYTSKIKAEKVAISIARKKKVELVCMRPTMMVGPSDKLFRSTHTVLSFLDRKIPIVPSGGASIADVRDVALAMKRAMELPIATGKTYLLGGENVTMKEYFDLMGQISHVPPPLFHPPPTLTRAVARMLDIYARKIRGKWEAGWDPVKAEMASCFWYIDSSAARRDLGFKARPLRESLEDTIQWIKQNRTKYGHPPPSSSLSSPSPSSSPPSPSSAPYIRSRM